MKIVFDKSFNEYSTSDEYNKVFLEFVLKWFQQMYEKYKVMSLTDFVRKLGCNNIDYFYKNNIIWIKGDTKDPDIKIDGNTIEIN